MHRERLTISQRIRQEHGSYREFAEAMFARFLLKVGRLRSLRRASLHGVERLVFVCTGNVCRSPYAEFKARELGFEAQSIGTRTSGGTPANPDAVRVAERRGINLHDHRSIAYDRFLVRPGDLFVCMTPTHARVVGRLFGTEHTALLGLIGSGESPLIADPYGRSDAFFEQCFDQIDQALNEAKTSAEVPAHD